MSLSELPPEILLQIVLNLDADDLINLSQVTGLTKFFQDSYIWLTKLNYDLTRNQRPNIKRDEFDRTTLSPDERYLELSALSGLQVTRGSEKYMSVKYCFNEAIEQNKASLARYFLQFGGIPLYSIRRGLYQATKLGNDELIELLLPEPGADIEMGLLGAAAGGHHKWVDYFIDQGARNYLPAIEEATRWHQYAIVVHLRFKLKVIACPWGGCGPAHIEISETGFKCHQCNYPWSHKYEIERVLKLIHPDRQN